MKVLINLSNHPSSNFTKEQKEFNKLNYDKVVDFSFPKIMNTFHEEEFLSIAQSKIEGITNYIRCDLFAYDYPEDLYVDIMICGEWGMTYLLVNQAKELQKYWQKAKMNRVYMDVVYPSSERIILERDGKTTHIFHFYKYRRYM